VRPLRLEVEGFTSFKTKVTVDFSGLDLFAITGPTGAGKSSLIDALVFALYGQVPRVGDDYKQLISHGAERLNVLLEFAVGGEAYRVVRTARRSAPSQQRLEQLAGGGSEPIADRAREIKARVEEILGLDYEGFTRAVVLPQGQFDAFLEGEPKERRKILVALLGLGVYDDMLKLANQKGAAARQEARFLVETLARDFADATEETLTQARSDLAAAEHETGRTEAALSRLDEGLALARRLRSARRDAAAIEKDGEAEARRRGEAEELLLRADDTRRGIAAELARLAGRLASLRSDPARHTALVGARPLAERLVGLGRTREEIRRSRTEGERALEAGKRALVLADKAVKTGEAAQVDAEASVAAARAARDEVHRRHAAIALRRTLAPGATCPVCGGKVGSVPKGEAPALETGEARVHEAEGAARDAASAAQTARLDLEKRRADVDARRADLARLEERSGEAGAEASRAEATLAAAGFGTTDLAEPARLVARIGAELRDLEAAGKARDGLEAERSGLEQKRSTLEAQVAAAAAERDGARSRLEALEARRAEAEALIGQAGSALRALSGGEGWGLATAAEGRDEVDVLEACRASRQRAATELAARVATLRQQAEQLAGKILRAGELRERREAQEKRAGLLKVLADHLKANELVAWIQEEALRGLARDGSGHLERLSQGRYALRLGSGGAAEPGARAEQDFSVVDRWNADSVRSVRTLSGGETFLASLALALALAESLARLSAGGRAAEALESLFLDEGFGSLDGETLDVVVSALDALHGGERMVGIVTHVRDLAERLPARLEVGRSGVSATIAIR
jgi:DNA repair protein SbcC/Rad50